MEEEEEEVANEEMAKGGQVGGSKGVGLGKGGGGGWLALLICKTANLRTLCLPALSSSFSTFSTTAFSSYGRPRSFSLLPTSIYLYHSLSLPRSTHFGSISPPLSRTLPRPLQTRIPIHIVTLSLSPFPSVSLACVPSSLWYVP